MIDCHMVLKLGTAQVKLNLMPFQIMNFEEDKQESFFNLRKQREIQHIETYR